MIKSYFEEPVSTLCWHWIWITKSLGRSVWSFTGHFWTYPGCTLPSSSPQTGTHICIKRLRHLHWRYTYGIDTAFLHSYMVHFISHKEALNDVIFFIWNNCGINYYIKIYQRYLNYPTLRSKFVWNQSFWQKISLKNICPPCTCLKYIELYI